MKKSLFLRILILILLTWLFLGTFHLSASAGGLPHTTPAYQTTRLNDSRPAKPTPTAKPTRPNKIVSKVATVITLNQSIATSLGEIFTLSGVIKNAFGVPVPNRSVMFTINGRYLGQARSDASGAFQRKFSAKLDAGSYSIIAYWLGTHDLAPASVSMVLEITPALVKIQTVPAIADVPFTMDGQRGITNDKGQVTFKISQAGDYPLTVLIDQYSNPTQKIKFGRWLNESYEPTNLIRVPTDKVVSVGLNVFRLVGQSFLDLDGYPVDPERVTEFMIRSAQGDVFIFHDGQPRWIPSSRIARRIAGLEETRLLYSVISVTIDGSNVVNQSQQRFYTYPTNNWSISLLLYSVRITARDGLFGHPVGKSVNLEFPDGRIENYPLDPDGSVVIHSLARGNYYTELVGSLGLQNRIPLTLSRNQEISTRVITYLDLAAIGLLAALIALGLLLYGRPSLLYLLHKKKLPPTPESHPGWVAPFQSNEPVNSNRNPEITGDQSYE